MCVSVCVYTRINFICKHAGTGLLYFVALTFVYLNYVLSHNKQTLLASHCFKKINSSKKYTIPNTLPEYKTAFTSSL